MIHAEGCVGARDAAQKWGKNAMGNPRLVIMKYLFLLNIIFGYGMLKFSLTRSITIASTFLARELATYNSFR